MSSEEETIRDQATMEGRSMPRRRRGPAARATVLYYLCRNGRHLEHPHLMELTLTSPNNALYLRDVIHRLDALRGKGMATMYSWSCKRRYKTGFVWHDISEDDVLLPAQGSSEYVLKGSLLLLHHSSPPADHEHQSVDTIIAPKVQDSKPTPEDESPVHSGGSRQAGRTNNSSPSSPTPIVEVEAPPPPLQQLRQPQPVLSSIAPSSSSTTEDRNDEAGRSSSSGSSSSPNKQTRATGGSTTSSSGSRSSPSPPPSFTPYNKEQKSVQSSIITAQDTGVQTDGASTGRVLHRIKDASTTSSMPGMPPAPTSNDVRQGGRATSGAGGRSRTLESLIRAEAIGRRGGCSATSKRILLEDDESSLVDDKEAVKSLGLGARLKPTNLLMQLVACGSTMSMRHHPACGLMRTTTHKPRYSSHHVELPPSSPVLTPLGTLIMRPETTGVRVVSESGDSGNCRCRWSVHQTAGKGDEPGKGMPTFIIEPSSSYDLKLPTSFHCSCNVSEKEASNGNSKNFENIRKINPQTTKMAPCEQSTSGTLVTITTDVRPNNGEHECSNELSTKTLSRSKSKRMSDPSAGKIKSPRVVSFHDEKEKVINIEERLASGARVIIQCAPLLKETYVSAKAM